MKVLKGISAALGPFIVLFLVASACATPVAPAAKPQTATTTQAPAATKQPEPTPIPSPTPTRTVLFVGNTDGVGVYIRRTPTMVDRIKVWSDGTQMLVVGNEHQSDGIAWKNVRDPDGNVGWVPTQYLVASVVGALAPAPQPTPPRFQSGGLGLVKSDWEAIHGSGSSDSSGFFHYDNEAYVVYFGSYSTPANAAFYVERQWGFPRPKPVSLEEARREGRSLIPSDSRLIKTYNAEQDLVDLYFSESLKGRFPASSYVGGELGEFTVIHVSANSVSRTIVGLGNNP